jgi:hypothetical protein
VAPPDSPQRLCRGYRSRSRRSGLLRPRSSPLVQATSEPSRLGVGDVMMSVMPRTTNETHLLLSKQSWL